MEHLYLGHWGLVLILLLFPARLQGRLLGWQHVVLLGLLWLDLLSRLYGLMSNQLYFWELCAFYERVYEMEGMFWLLFAYHHVGALVGLLLMVDYLRQSRLFAIFWTFLAAYPLLLDWWQSSIQTDLEGQQFYELPLLSTTRRDVTSLIVEFTPSLSILYTIGLLVVFLVFYYFLYKNKPTSPLHSDSNLVS